MEEVYILAGRRTPGGSFLGSLSQVPAVELGARAVEGVLEIAPVEPREIGQLFMGQVLSAGSGQAPARQVALGAKLPVSLPCTTVNKVCGSGMEAIILGHWSIKCGESKLVVAGGMENMSRVPHLLNGRRGIKFGRVSLLDSLQCDGLEDAYSGHSMGLCAEECVKKYRFTREEQDSFARQSFERSQKAMAEGIFAKEIVPVTTPKGVIVKEDEGPSKANFAKMPTLAPAFDRGGTITPANASTLNDGGAAVLLGGESYRDRAKFRIVASARHAQEPTWFTTAPAMVIKKALAKAELDIGQIELFEINEAFAVVAMATMKDLELDPARVNIYGGAISLGHPLGCSGTRIVVTLMTAMEEKKARYGMAGICIGGGEGLALIIEKMT